MNMKEIINRMFHSFFTLLGIAVIANFVYLLICIPNAILNTGDLGALILLAVAADLSYFIFYSKKELTKNELLMRHIIQLIYFLGETLFIAYSTDWIRYGETGETKQVIVFVGLVIIAYILVFVVNNYHAKKTADVLNEKLKQRNKK